MQTSAVGLNYHIVVPCVNGTLFYFLVHCLCLYFHVNILFSSSKYSRSHPGLACWKSAPQQAIRWFLKAQISSAALCPLFSTVVVIQNVFFFPPPHISLVSWLNPDAHMLHVHRRTTLDHGNDRTGWSITENPGQWFDKRGLIRNHFNNLLHNTHITGVFWPSSLVLRTSFSFLFFFK